MKKIFWAGWNPTWSSWSDHP